MMYERPAVRNWGSIHDFLDLFFPRTLQEEMRQVDDDFRVEKLRRLIERAPVGLQWNPGEVCRQLGLHMCNREARRLFKACTGMGFKQFTRKTRLDYAAQQLKATNAPIKTVAAEVGYRHLSTFTRSFLKQFGVGPMEFRRMWYGKGIFQRHDDWTDGSYALSTHTV